MSTYNHWFIRARLKTRQLLLLVALAEEGNIHRAAQVLSMTQPAASKLLKDLEDVLEVSLFDRLPRGMRPTWYGETMIRHARMALANLNQAHDEIGALKRGHYGQVGRASAAARTANSVWLRSARAYSATTSRVSDGLVLTPVVVPISQRPLIRCRGFCCVSPSFMGTLERTLVLGCGKV